MFRYQTFQCFLPYGKKTEENWWSDNTFMHWITNSRTYETESDKTTTVVVNNALGYWFTDVPPHIKKNERKLLHICLNNERILLFSQVTKYSRMRHRWNKFIPILISASKIKNIPMMRQIVNYVSTGSLFLSSSHFAYEEIQICCDLP